MSRSSRFPGFYTHPVQERRRLIAESAHCEPDELARALDHGGMDASTADKTVENVIGTYALPFCVGLNVRINDRDYVVPMVIEEPSVVAAASNAAKMIREGGGFRSESDEPLMVSQIQMWDVADADEATARLMAQPAPMHSVLASSPRRPGNRNQGR